MTHFAPTLRAAALGLVVATALVSGPVAAGSTIGEFPAFTWWGESSSSTTTCTEGATDCAQAAE